MKSSKQQRHLKRLERLTAQRLPSVRRFRPKKIRSVCFEEVLERRRLRYFEEAGCQIGLMTVRERNATDRKQSVRGSQRWMEIGGGEIVQPIKLLLLSRSLSFCGDLQSERTPDDNADEEDTVVVVDDNDVSDDDEAMILDDTSDVVV